VPRRVGADDEESVNRAMAVAAEYDQEVILRLCREWGASDIERNMARTEEVEEGQGACFSALRDWL
jgi:hypothetical protein